MYNYLTDSIKKSLIPVTEKHLEQKFIKLGIKQGDIVMAHVSLSSLGYVIGGSECLYNALKNVVGEEGTIVVPSQTVEISDPATWEYPPVPVEWHDLIRDSMPAYNTSRSFSKAMGSFSNFLGILPQAIRSSRFSLFSARCKEVLVSKSVPIINIFDCNLYIFPSGDSFPKGKS